MERIKPEIKDWEVAHKGISSHSTHESDLLENELRDLRVSSIYGAQRKNLRHHEIILPPTISRIKAKSQCN